MSPFVLAQSGDVFIAPAAGGAAVKLVERAAHPAWSPDGRSVAFQSDRDGQWDIWIVAAEGGEARPLRSDVDIDYQPSFSPDGRFVAYASLASSFFKARIRVVGSDGKGGGWDIDAPGAIALAPAWSPDGRAVYFATSRTQQESRTSLWRATVPAKGRPPRLERLTFGEAVDSDPAFAAGGGRFAYARATNAPDLFELDLRSGTVRQVTSGSGSEDFPHQSPDGRSLLFASDRQGGSGLFMMPIGGGPWQPISSADFETQMGRWSPDGRSVAFVRSNGRELGIVVQAVGGLQARSLAAVTRDAGGVQGPVWSPDGRAVAFSEQRTAPERSAAIRVVELAGGAREPTAGLGGMLMFPSWSPDGKQLAFQREHNGPRQIWTVPVAGGEPRELSPGNTRELSHPQWSARDPDRILVVVDHKNLALLSVATGAVTPLTRYDDSTRYLDYPSWSNDGTKVFFSMTRTIGDLYLLDDTGR
jgi:Tol biopolymer transport system component